MHYMYAVLVRIVLASRCPYNVPPVIGYLIVARAADSSDRGRKWPHTDNETMIHSRYSNVGFIEELE